MVLLYVVREIIEDTNEVAAKFGSYELAQLPGLSSDSCPPGRRASARPGRHWDKRSPGHTLRGSLVSNGQGFSFRFAPEWQPDLSELKGICEDRS
jgi:hypothetical protein